VIAGQVGLNTPQPDSSTATSRLLWLGAPRLQSDDGSSIFNKQQQQADADQSDQSSQQKQQQKMGRRRAGRRSSLDRSAGAGAAAAASESESDADTAASTDGNASDGSSGAACVGGGSSGDSRALLFLAHAGPKGGGDAGAIEYSGAVHESGLCGLLLDPSEARGYAPLSVHSSALLLRLLLGAQRLGSRSLGMTVMPVSWCCVMSWRLFVPTQHMHMRVLRSAILFSSPKHPRTSQTSTPTHPRTNRTLCASSSARRRSWPAASRHLLLCTQSGGCLCTRHPRGLRGMDPWRLSRWVRLAQGGLGWLG